MRKVKSQRIMQGWFVRDVHKRKELTMVKKKFPSCKVGRSEDFSCICYLQKIQSVPNECKIFNFNGILEEEVYIEKPKWFLDPNKKNMICKLNKDFYGLKQALRAWYDNLHNYLVKVSFKRTPDNCNLYLNNEFFLSKKNVNYIIF